MWNSRGDTSNAMYGGFYQSRPATSYSLSTTNPPAYGSTSFSYRANVPPSTSYTAQLSHYTNPSSGAARTPWSAGDDGFGSSHHNYSSPTSYANNYSSSSTSYNPPPVYNPPSYGSPYNSYTSTSYQPASTSYTSTSYYGGGGGGGCRACQSKSSYASYKPASSYSWQSSSRYGYY